jgi:hypothetical protein
VRDNGLTATISVANTDGSPVFGGEAGVAPAAPCRSAAHRPTPRTTTLSGWPRESDGSAFGAGAITEPVGVADAARFYVFVTG